MDFSFMFPNYLAVLGLEVRTKSSLDAEFSRSNQNVSCETTYSISLAQGKVYWKTKLPSFEFPSRLGLRDADPHCCH